MSKRTSKRGKLGPARSRPLRITDTDEIASSADAEPERPPDMTAGTDKIALARLAEAIWRIERRAKREEGAIWAAPLLERVNDDLRDLGVEIIDRTGTPYRDGEMLEKLHSEAPDGWAGSLVVTEVICPTIRIGGVLVERGKVVVGPEFVQPVEETI